MGSDERERAAQAARFSFTPGCAFRCCILSKEYRTGINEVDPREFSRFEMDKSNMITERIQTNSGCYLLVSCSREGITSEGAILSVFEACHEQQTDNLIILESCFHADFFDLKTGLAGEIFHKLSIYKIRTAFVGKWAEIKNERFQELIYECNKGNQFHFAPTLTEAERWLAS
jgi:hypothetical protein